MRIFAILIVLGLIVGCSSSPSKKDTSKKDDPQPKSLSKEEKLAQKKRELDQVDREIADLAAEKKSWESRDPSEEKISRLQEIPRMQSEAHERRRRLKEEILALEPEAKTADEGLDAMEDAAKDQEDELTERIRKQAESEEARKLDEAARKKEADMARMKKDKDALEGAGGGDSGKEGPIFEETWADVILRVKAELQRYKRW